MAHLLTLRKLAHLLLTASLIAGLALGGCRRATEAVVEPEATPAATEAPSATTAAVEAPEPSSDDGAPQLAARSPTGAPARASGAPEGEALASDDSAREGVLAAEDDDEEDAEEKKDYWAKIKFDASNFEEVREYVKTYYIEENIDESRAFAEAANFGLMALPNVHELLPVAFYKARKDHPDEEGRLKGKTIKLNASDPYVIHVLPVETDAEKEKRKKERKKRLSDDEIRVKWQKLNERRELLEKAWKDIQFDQSRFQAVMKFVEEHAAKAKKEQDKKLNKYWIAAGQGYLFSLDPHSSLISWEAWEESTKATTDSSFTGIGAVLTQRDDRTIIESPIENLPAQKAGLRAGDLILKVDDKSIDGMPLHKVVKRIRGPKGSKVKLTIHREGEPDDRVVVIQREQVEIKNVSHKMVPEHKDIGYIKLTGFVPTSLSEMERQLQELTSKAAGGKLRGLVFDLRNNSGGLLQQGVKISDLFLRAGNIVTVKNRTRDDETYRSHDDKGTWDVPMVVLTNDGSASASEIVASALQDNARALVVGERSFGKASVQTLYSPMMRKDFYIKLTIARYYSPSGRTIQVVGVRPDLEVPPEVGGKMPLGYREENLSHYLKPIETNYTSPNADLAKKVKACADARGLAEKIHAADPHPQVKYDYQLMKGADFVECLIELQAQAAK